MTLEERIVAADLAPKDMRKNVTKFPRVGTGKRRTAADLSATVNAIVAVVKKRPGARAAQICAELGL